MGIILFVLGFLANIAVENYKNQSIKERFFLEKRLEAIQKISQGYMTMHNNFDSITLKPSMNNDEKKQLENNIQNYIDVWTEWSIILSKKYRHELDYITWIYIGLGAYEFQEMIEYRKYLIDLYFKFNDMCQVEIGFLKESEMATFRFIEWPAQKADTLGAQKFFRANYEEWLRLKKKE